MGCSSFCSVVTETFYFAAIKFFTLSQFFLLLHSAQCHWVTVHRLWKSPTSWDQCDIIICSQKYSLGDFYFSCYA